MSRNNAVKIVTNSSQSTGYHFKSYEDSSSYVITSKHSICNQTNICEPYKKNVEGCCRACPIKFGTEGLQISNKKQQQFTPIKVYSFPQKDLAIVSVVEQSFTPLKIKQIEQASDFKFACYGYFEEGLEAGRILLDNPEIDTEAGISFFNIESFSTPELIEKSEGYKGISGSLVSGSDSQDIVTAYAVITNNEENNDLSGENLWDIDFESLHKFFDSKLFISTQQSVAIDTSLCELFEQIDKYSIEGSTEITLLVPVNKGIPHFNMIPIVEKLADELGLVLGTNPKSRTLNNFSVLKVLRDNKELKPVYQLLSSRVVEALMNAPHIYSSYVNDTNYHHMHFVNGSEEIDFVVSAFGGEEDLNEDLNAALEDMLNNINQYSISSKLIAERSFLNMKYSEQECELLYQVLFAEENQVVRNLSIVYCIDIQHIQDADAIEHIKTSVQNACNNLKQETLNIINKGLKVNLFVVPVNERNELTELMEKLLNDC